MFGRHSFSLPTSRVKPRRYRWILGHLTDSREIHQRSISINTYGLVYEAIGWTPPVCELVVTGHRSKRGKDSLTSGNYYPILFEDIPSQLQVSIALCLAQNPIYRPPGRTWTHLVRQDEGENPLSTDQATVPLQAALLRLESCNCYNDWISLSSILTNELVSCDSTYLWPLSARIGRLESTGNIEASRCIERMKGGYRAIPMSSRVEVDGVCWLLCDGDPAQRWHESGSSECIDYVHGPGANWVSALFLTDQNYAEFENHTAYTWGRIDTY